jgi:diacylglycerol kinase family enzyme
MRPIVLINALAGTAAQHDVRALPRRVDRALGEAGLSAELRRTSPPDLKAALMKARGAERPVIIAGGDGSVSTAVQLFAGTGIPLGVIPLGTYNLLGHDLGMSTEVEEAARQLASARELQIDLGRLRDRYFHTLCGIGFFSRVARERAQLRRQLPGAKVVTAAIAAVRSFTRGGNLDVEIETGRGKERFRSPAILITNNLFEGSAWRRSQLDAGVLELNVARGDVSFPLLRGGVAAMLGSWRESEDIVSWRGTAFTLSFRRPRVFVSLDGEVRRPRTPLHVELVPRALTALAAPRAIEPPDGEAATTAAPDRSIVP